MADNSQTKVKQALDSAFKQAIEDEGTEGPRLFDISSDRYIIFSDHHRGARNGADDFRFTERAYNAALAYYYNMGYTLVVLGDAEELWEERPGPVLKAYTHTFQLEAQFHQDGRYLRFWGNHDDAWQFDDMIKRHLVPIYGPDLKVHEGLRIQVVDGSEQIGTFFLTHGHQGTLDSDRWAWGSKLAVRYFWRPIQRITKTSLNTPAKSWQLREGHNAAMYEWAEEQDRLVLIAGHTHRPVFKSKSHAAQIQDELAELEAMEPDKRTEETLRMRAKLLARLEWIRAQEQQDPELATRVEQSKPCYFNTGCCSFLDGDVTGLEIAEGQIRLVRWPDVEKRPQPQILTHVSLHDVFAAL